METNRPMLMLYLGLLTSLLARPARCSSPGWNGGPLQGRTSGAATGPFGQRSRDCLVGGPAGLALLHRGGQRASAGCGGASGAPDRGPL